MDRAIAVAVAIAMTVPALPGVAAKAASNPAGSRHAGQQQTATLNGTAQTAQGQNLADYTVHLRNLQTGELTGVTTSNAAGQFTFTGLNPGNYVVEIVNPSGAIVATSPATTIGPGATVTVSVTSSTALAGAAGGAAAPAAGGGFFTSTIGIVTLAAIAAGVTSIVVVANQGNASPSR